MARLKQGDTWAELHRYHRGQGYWQLQDAPQPKASYDFVRSLNPEEARYAYDQAGQADLLFANSAAATERDPVWNGQGLFFSDGAYARVQNDSEVLTEEEFTEVFFFNAAELHDGMVYTAHDHFNVKVTLTGHWRVEFKRSLNNYFTNNGTSYTANTWHLGVVRKSLSEGVSLYIDDTVRHFPDELSPLGRNTGGVRYGTHTNGTLGFKGVLAGHDYYGWALSPRELEQAKRKLVAEVRGKHGHDLGPDLVLNDALPLFAQAPAISTQSLQSATTLAGHLEWEQYSQNWEPLKTALLESNFAQYRAAWSHPDSMARAKELIAGGMKVGVSIDPNSGVIPWRFDDAGNRTEDDPYWAGSQSGTVETPFTAIIDELGPENVAFVAQVNEPDVFAVLKGSPDQPYEWHNDADGDPAHYIRGDAMPEYVAHLQKLTRDTALSLRENPAYAHIPHLGPAFPSGDGTGMYALYGDQSAWLTHTDAHTYLGARNPETTGWGPNGYGSLDEWHIDHTMSVIGPELKRASTEGGWSTYELGYDEQLHAMYLMRYFLEKRQLGYSDVMTMYQLTDHEHSNPREASFGLVRDVTWERKPAYGALQALFGLLKDPGEPFAPASLTYALSGQLSGVETLVMQKRDGSFWLALWQGAIGMHPDTQERYVVPEQAVGLHLETAHDLSVFDPLAAGATAVQSAAATTSTTFTVGEAPKLIQLTPATL